MTQVQKSDIATGAAENRGPGQTGELLVGQDGAAPAVGGGDGAAVIAFWDSRAHARNSPNARQSSFGTHADTIGSVTVQPTNQLVLFALRSGHSAKARQQAFEAAVKRIEGCVG